MEFPLITQDELEMKLRVRARRGDVEAHYALKRHDPARELEVERRRHHDDVMRRRRALLGLSAGR